MESEKCTGKDELFDLLEAHGAFTREIMNLVNEDSPETEYIVSIVQNRGRLEYLSISKVIFTK